MEYYRFYRPDRTIRDIYEKSAQSHKFDELGLSPYARIGSLAHDNPNVRIRYRRWPKPDTNYHSFTYVGPLVGDTLSPNDREAWPLSQDIKNAIERNRELIAAEIGILAGDRTVRNTQHSAIANTSAITAIIAGVSVLLLVFAAIVAPQPIRVSNPGGQSQGQSNPNIISNRTPSFLSGILHSGNKNKGSQIASKGSGTSTSSSVHDSNTASNNTPAALPVYSDQTNSTPTSSSSLQGSSPVSGTTGQLSNTAGSLTGNSSGSTPTQSTGSSGGGSGGTLSGGSSGSTGSSGESGSSSGTSLPTLPGVTSPVSTTVPSTSLTVPGTSKPLISTSPITIIL